MSDTAELPTVPKARLEAEIEKRKALEAQVDQLLTDARTATAAAKEAAAKLKTADATAESLTRLQAEHASLRASSEAATAKSAAHVAMLGAGVTDESVRDYMLHRYDTARGAAGEKGLEWAKWWAAQLAEPPTVLRSALPAAAPAAPPPPPAGGKPPAAPGSEQRGVTPPPTPPSPWSPGSIASMSSADWKAQKAEILKGARLGVVGG